MNFTAEDKRKCIERELGWRKFVYPGRVSNKKMSQEKADREIAIMEAIRQDYLQAEKKEQLI